MIWSKLGQEQLRLQGTVWRAWRRKTGHLAVAGEKHTTTGSFFNSVSMLEYKWKGPEGNISSIPLLFLWVVRVERLEKLGYWSIPQVMTYIHQTKHTDQPVNDCSCCLAAPCGGCAIILAPIRSHSDPLSDSREWIARRHESELVLIYIGKNMEQLFYSSSMILVYIYIYIHTN